jgi:predicted Rdx family selenoprotein
VRVSGGNFNVIVGNDRIFSKKDEGRFPSEREILDKLKELGA